jgi:hypothetical protein
VLRFADPYCDVLGDPVEVNCTVCDEYAQAGVVTRAADAKRVGGAAFMTEFGACSVRLWAQQRRFALRWD